MFDLRPSLFQRKRAKTLTNGPLLEDTQMTGSHTNDNEDGESSFKN